MQLVRACFLDEKEMRLISATGIHIQKAPLQRDWTVVASDWEKGLIPKMVSGNAVSRITFRITGFQKALKSESPELRPFEFLWTAFSKMTKCEREAEFFTAEHGNGASIHLRLGVHVYLMLTSA